MSGLSILHTESSCGWGGQEIRVLDEALGLMRRGHALHLACPGESRIYAEAQRRGLPATALPIARKGLRGLAALARLIRTLRPQVVNTHSSTDSWLATLALRLAGARAPIVRTRHISAPMGGGAASRWLYRSAARVVTTGEALRRDLIAAARLDATRVVSVPTGVDLERFGPGDRAAARAKLGLPAEVFVAGIVATLRSWKGHADLVEAVAALDAPRLRLVIVGHGPGWDPLHAQVARLGLGERVHFAGEQREVAPWLHAMDLFVLPSYANEGMPQAIQQAMACAIPVVSTAVGAIGELIDDGRTGVLVPPRDPARLAQTLRRLIDAPEERARLGAAGRAAALEHFSQTRMLDCMEALFRDAAAR